MALNLADRVLETASAPGTGAVTLLGAVTGYRTFSSTVGNGNTCYYTIADQSGSNWEVGIGTYATSGNTLTRTTILSSSNAGSTVNFASGTQNVFVTYPSEKAVYLDASGNVQPSLGTATFSSVTDSGLTSGRVTYATTGGLLTDSANMTFNGTTLTLANDASISGLTVGKGGGAVASNTAVGTSALSSTNTSAGNTGVGAYSLYLNTSGAANSAFGNSALLVNSSGSSNVAVGQQALQANTTASNNTAVGYQAGYSNTTGTSNVFLGYQAGYTSNYNGTAGNVCVGVVAGYSLTTGIQNTFIGASSAATACGYYITTGSKNTIIGGYSGNGGGLDIRTASNYIVLSDGDGNPLISTANSQTVALKGAVPNSGTGITFPATQSASSDANTLDDYEKGTWTPNQGGGLTVVGTFSSTGKYTKIGNLVFVVGTLSATTSLACGNGGAVIINNLPFYSATSGTGNTINATITTVSTLLASTTNVYSNAISATTIVYFSLTYTV